MDYSRVEISNDIEKRILTGMIVHTQYLRDISTIIQTKFFKIDYIKKIAGWVLAYYKQYKEAPGKNFESIFYSKTEKLKSAEIEIMENFLQEISDQYILDNQDSFPFNKELLYDHTVEFCRDRQLEILQKTIEGHRLNKDFSKAEGLVADFGKISQQVSQWINPLDFLEVEKTFEDEEENKLFKLPGALGDLIGYMQRGWLVGLMGPTKRGKCISGDSKVLLSNGKEIEIRELVNKKIKEKVVSFNEKTQRFESIEISEFFNNGIKPCWTITTRTGRKISATINHKFLTPLGWKKMKEISIGEHIAVNKKQNNKKQNLTRQRFECAKETKATYEKYINSEIMWDKVKTITYAGEIDTYDISIPKLHNFVTDNCLVHNSFYEMEIGFHALCAKLKIAIFSFEMNKTVYKKRIYKRMTAMAEKGGEYKYPVFDCQSNQDGSCQKVERTNRSSLIGRDEKVMDYSPTLGYKPCVACRGKKDFYPTSWWRTQNQKEDLSPSNISKKIKTFKKLFGDNLRIRCFPAFTAGFDEAIAELDNLKYQGFEPDVILFDYFDIMSSEVMNELEDENRKWKKGKGLAGERHCLVINCHQGNRESEERQSIKQKHTGGSIKKLQHLDLDLTLNQTEEEKKQGRMRIQILVNRHEEGIEKGEVIVLQQLKLGQPFIDSEWRREK